MHYIGKLLLLFAIISSVFFVPDSGETAPRVNAEAALLVDASSGQVLYDKNGYKRMSPASLTKLTTCIIALEYGHLGDIVEISNKAGATSVGSTIGLTAGDKITLGNLIEAALITSANDSTVAIAEHIAGSHDVFINLMNKKAVAMGALETKFENTNGYSSVNHYTSARDLAIITRYALQNETINRLVGTREITVAWYNKKKEETIKNTNRLLTNEEYEGIDGVKTGTSIRAGKCLIASATRENRRLVAIILNSSDRYGDAKRLLDYGFYNTQQSTLCNENEIIGMVPVRGGIKPAVQAVTKNGVSVYVDKDNPVEVKKNVILWEQDAPVKAGDKVGEVVYVTVVDELARVDLVAAESVRRPYWPVRMWEKLHQ